MQAKSESPAHTHLDEPFSFQRTKAECVSGVMWSVFGSQCLERSLVSLACGVAPVSRLGGRAGRVPIHSSIACELSLYWICGFLPHKYAVAVPLHPEIFNVEKCSWLSVGVS